MQSGQCEAGKQLFRKGFDAEWPSDAPEHAQSVLDATVAQMCQGSSLSTRDQILHARGQLESGGLLGKPVDASVCQGAYDTLKKLGAITGDNRSDDPSRVTAVGIMVTASKCFSRAGDCAGAFKVYSELTKIWRPEQKDQFIRPAFEGTVGECKGK